jgi:hypothetical protein
MFTKKDKKMNIVIIDNDQSKGYNLVDYIDEEF